DGGEVDGRVRLQVFAAWLEGRPGDLIEGAIVAATAVAEGGEAAAHRADVVQHSWARVVSSHPKACVQRGPDLAAQAKHEATAAPDGEVPRGSRGDCGRAGKGHRDVGSHLASPGRLHGRSGKEVRFAPHVKDPDRLASGGFRLCRQPARVLWVHATRQRDPDPHPDPKPSEWAQAKEPAMLEGSGRCALLPPRASRVDRLVSGTKGSTRTTTRLPQRRRRHTPATTPSTRSTGMGPARTTRACRAVLTQLPAYARARLGAGAGIRASRGWPPTR